MGTNGFIILLLLTFPHLNAVTYGSDSTTAAPQAFTTITGADNKIANYAIMDGGFGFASATTTCSYASIFPVTGPRIRLNGGRLFLSRDLVFTNTSKNIFSGGVVYGTNNAVVMSPMMQEIASTFTFDSTSILLRGDVTLSADLVFRGNSFIYGNGNTITLSGAGRLSVETGRLVIEDTFVTGVQGQNLNCKINGAAVTLRNSNLLLAGDYRFSTGSLLVDIDATISGSGTSKFVYSTRMGSTINSLSTLMLDKNLTFSYAPTAARRSLIYMPDKTAWLYLDGCTLFSTKTGLTLTSGTLLIDNKVTLTLSGDARAASEAIQLGNGVASSDLDIRLLSGAMLNVYGRLEYQNTQ